MSDFYYTLLILSKLIHPRGDVLLVAVAALVDRNAEELVLWAGDNGYT